MVQSGNALSAFGGNGGGIGCRGLQITAGSITDRATVSLRRSGGKPACTRRPRSWRPPDAISAKCASASDLSEYSSIRRTSPTGFLRQTRMIARSSRESPYMPGVRMSLFQAIVVERSGQDTCNIHPAAGTIAEGCHVPPMTRSSVEQRRALSPRGKLFLRQKPDGSIPSDAIASRISDGIVHSPGAWSGSGMGESVAPASGQTTVTSGNVVSEASADRSLMLNSRNARSGGIFARCSDWISCHSCVTSQLCAGNAAQSRAKSDVRRNVYFRITKALSGIHFLHHVYHGMPLMVLKRILSHEQRACGEREAEIPGPSMRKKMSAV